MNNIIFLLSNKNTYNNLVYNTLNDCIDASTIFKNEINWKMPKNLSILNHASSNESVWAYSPAFYNRGDKYYYTQIAKHSKGSSRDFILIGTNNTLAAFMYRPCINIHE